MTEVFEAYAQRGRNAGWRYVAAGGLALLLTVILAACIQVPLQISGLAPADLPKRMLDPSDSVVFFSAIGVMFASLLGGLALAARWVQGKRFGDIVGAWSWRVFGLGAAAWLAVLLVGIGLDVLLAPGGFRISATAETPALALLALVAIIPQIFAEEFIFRGWLTQGLFLALRRPMPTAVLSGLLFGAMHIPNGVPQAVSATVFGVLLALIAIRLGGIAFSTGIHLVNNFFGSVVVVSAQDVFKGVPGVLSQSTPHLIWFDVATSCLGLTLITVFLLRARGHGQAFEVAPQDSPAK